MLLIVATEESEMLNARQIVECSEELKNGKSKNYFTDKYDISIYHNYLNREIIQGAELILLHGVHDLVLSTKSNGKDFSSESLRIVNGEMKTMTHKGGSLTPSSIKGLEFDKQKYDEKRRKQIFDYDGIMYSLFSKRDEIIFSFLIKGMENIELIVHPLFEREQKNIKLESGRDSIQIKAYDIITNKNCDDTNITITFNGSIISKSEFLSNLKGAK